MPKALSSQEQALLDKIEYHKQKLATLQKKQKLELGALAYKHGLHAFDNKKLDDAFLKLAQELNHGAASSN